MEQKTGEIMKEQVEEKVIEESKDTKIENGKTSVTLQNMLTDESKPLVIIKGITLLVCIVLFTLLAIDIRGPYTTAWIDVAGYRLLHLKECGALKGFSLIMTNMVNPVVMLVLSFSMLHLLKQRKYMVALFGNLFLTVLLNLAIKGSFMRIRPPEELRLVTEIGYSFPSGHSMLAASFYGFLAFMLCQAPLRKRTKAIGCLLGGLIVFLVGCSRIYLGVHYTTDVIGGFLAGMIYLILFTRVVKWYFRIEETLASKMQFSAKWRLVASFLHAFHGIADGLRNEPNMMIHYSAVVLVVVFGVTLRLSTLEWSISLILCGLVIAMELVNTAIEAVVDLVTDQYRELARLAKDTAAGAVLVTAITAAIVGGLIFFPKLVMLFTG